MNKIKDKNNFDIVAIGGITEDIMFHTSDLQIINSPLLSKIPLFAFRPGDKIISDDKVFYVFGGGGANVAVSLARLGFKTKLIGAIGDDSSGERVRNYLIKEKIDPALEVIKKYWTGLSFVVTAGRKNEHVIFSHRAANERLLIDEKKLLCCPAKWFYLTSLSGNQALKNLNTVFHAAALQAVSIAWNPGSAQLKLPFARLRGFLKQTNLLILNKEEAKALLHSAGIAKDDSLKNLASALATLGPKMVAITDGANGAAILDSVGKYYFAKATSAKAVNTTGAGDAFGSSLLGGLLLFKGDTLKALKLGLIRSGLVVKHIGAQVGLNTLSEIKKNYHL